MSAPRDGVPGLTPLAETLRREFLLRHRNVALVLVRRGGCGCGLGSIYRLPSGDLLIGRRRAMVQKSAASAQARDQQVFLAIDEVEEVVLVSEIACRHEKNLRLPLDEVREAVAAVARGGRRPGVSLTL